MDGEHIGELDVQRRFRASKQVVELIDLELRLGVANVYEVRPDILQTVDGFGNVAVEWLEVQILTTKQLSSCHLPEDLPHSNEVAAHYGGQPTIDYTPVLGLSESRLDVRFPHPMTSNLQQLLLRLVLELLAQLLKHLLGEIADTIGHPVKNFLKH